VRSSRARALVALSILLGASCRDSQPSGPPPSVLASAATPGGPPSAERPPEDEAIAKGMKRASDVELHLTRAAIDRLFDQTPPSVRSARLVPEKDHATVVGLRVFGVRANTTLDSLGVWNGDRIEDVNGRAITTRESLEEALNAIRGESKVTVRIKRVGKPVTLTYVVDG
jgi:hypothetical protein